METVLEKEYNIMSYLSRRWRDIIVKVCKGHKNVLSIQCKEYYKEFVYIKYERPTALFRWEEVYYYADFYWPVLFKIPYKVAHETNVQSLQFKIINRQLPCKENLYLWGKESSDKCHLCNEIDIIEHFFAQFSYNRVFWQDVSKLIQRALDINIRLYDSDIIAGLPAEEDIFRIINFCILYGKKYVFACRINENIMSIDRFKSKLKNRREVEIYIIDSFGIGLNTDKILLIELYDSLCS